MSAESVPPDMLAMAYTLVCALNDAALPEPTRLLGAKVMELTYGDGYTSLRVDRQEDLGVLAGIGKTHVREHLDGLIEAGILLHYPEEKVFEPLPNPGDWKVAWLCRLGGEGRRALASDLAARNRRYRKERDFGELEMTFQRDPINTAAAEAARESAFAEQGSEPQALATPSAVSRPSGPGAAGGRSTPPPGITGETTPAGPKPRLREMVRQARLALRVQEDAPKVTPEVTFSTPAQQHHGSEVPRDGTSTSATGAKVTSQVTLPGPEPQRSGPKVTPQGTFGGKSYAPRNFSGGPRARASDDHLDHLPSQSKQLSSASSSDDQGDEGRGDERGAAGWRQMVGLGDELLGDLQRTMGVHMGSHTDDWRRAIFLARMCVYLALESTKNNWGSIKRHPGGYLLQCFLDQCDRRGYELPPDLFRGMRARRKERGGRRP